MLAKRLVTFCFYNKCVHEKSDESTSFATNTTRINSFSKHFLIPNFCQPVSKQPNGIVFDSGRRNVVHLLVEQYRTTKISFFFIL